MQYFKESEFKCNCGECDAEINSVFASLIDQARHKAGIPFGITSGVRCKAHNHREGGSVTSSHLKGLAVDISASSSRQRFLITKALIEVGFTRIGIAKSFVHVDADPDKPAELIWTY